MTSIIVDAYHVRSLTKALGLVLMASFPVCVSAQWLTVEMEGARELIHLDTANGALYVGSDCSPMLYFSEQPQRRSKMLKNGGKYYRIQKSRSRSLKKSASALPTRLPTAIVVDGDSVNVISDSVIGQALAKGKVRTSVLAGRKKAAQCK